MSAGAAAIEARVVPLQELIESASEQWADSTDLQNSRDLSEYIAERLAPHVVLTADGQPVPVYEQVAAWYRGNPRMFEIRHGKKPPTTDPRWEPVYRKVAR